MWWEKREEEEVVHSVCICGRGEEKELIELTLMFIISSMCEACVFAYQSCGIQTATSDSNAAAEVIVKFIPTSAVNFSCHSFPLGCHMCCLKLTACDDRWGAYVPTRETSRVKGNKGHMWDLNNFRPQFRLKAQFQEEHVKSHRIKHSTHKKSSKSKWLIPTPLSYPISSHPPRSAV
jgi:hypothetical protein